jgi:FixJ family two-component response regulator/GAF domain-containing protein
VGIRVGIVDDELFFREAIGEILLAADIACVTGEDGLQALALAEDPSVGVMLLDVRMPGMDGLAVLRELRERRPTLRVLMLSASTDQETVLEALRLGASDYLAKPIHDEELVHAVRRAANDYTQAADAERLRRGLARVVSLTEKITSGASRLGAGDRHDFLVQAAVEGASELLQAGRTSLLLRDETSGDPDGLGESWQLRVVAARDCVVPIAELPPAVVGEGVAGGVAARGEALLVAARSQDERFAGVPMSGRYSSDSFVVVPLLADHRFSGSASSDRPGSADADAVLGSRAFGVLCATEPEHGEAFGAEDLALLRLLAGRVAELLLELREHKSPPATAGFAQIAPPADVARARTASSKDRPGEPADRDAELVREICDALVNEFEPERVLRAVLEPVARELNAAPVALYLLDGATGELHCEAQLDGGVAADRKTLAAARGLTGTVMQTGSLIATQSPELDARFDAQVDTPEDGRRGPLLCVPLRLRGKVIGLCRAFLPGGEIASPRTGEALAAALSAAVRNVLLYRSLVESIEEVAEARRTARSAGSL